MLSLPILAGLKSGEFCVILHHSPESSSKHAITAYHLLLGRWPPMRKEVGFHRDPQKHKVQNIISGTSGLGYENI